MKLNEIAIEKKKKVFLGGTCNESTWRDELIELLSIDYFNPVVDDWTEECYQEELKQRKICDYVLYVITPKMSGVYSIAEVVQDSNKKSGKTIFCVLSTDNGTSFDKGQLKSLEAVSKMVASNGANVFSDLKSVAEFLNSKS